MGFRGISRRDFEANHVGIMSYEIEVLLPKKILPNHGGYPILITKKILSGLGRKSYPG